MRAFRVPTGLVKLIFDNSDGWGEFVLGRIGFGSKMFFENVGAILFWGKLFLKNLWGELVWGQIAYLFNCTEKTQFTPKKQIVETNLLATFARGNSQNVVQGDLKINFESFIDYHGADHEIRFLVTFWVFLLWGTRKYVVSFAIHKFISGDFAVYL